MPRYRLFQLPLKFLNHKINNISPSIILRTTSSSSRTMSTKSNSATPSWASKLQIKDLKHLVKLATSNNDPCNNNYIERSDYEQVVYQNFKSLEDAQSTVRTLEQIQKILQQDRSVQNFTYYQPSQSHVKRMQELSEMAPELYNNPLITSRSKWFNHPMYYQNSQMPPYHVHFRQELQTTIQYLHQALQLIPMRTISDKNRNDKQDKIIIIQNINSAYQYFQGCMRGLHGHVQIEEYICFPLYQQTFPHINFKFLYEDHQDLHQSEHHVQQSLKTFLTNNNKDKISTVSNQDIVNLIQIVLEFDNHLMAHLGEEEEIVVPLSLTDKPIHF